MSRILSTTIGTSLNQWVEHFQLNQYSGGKLQIWTFNDKVSRHCVEHELRNLGFDAEVNSAYKPLVHFFLEKLNEASTPFECVTIEYPIHPSTSNKRFLLEAYPLAAMIKANKVNFIASEASSDHYQVAITDVSRNTARYSVFAPNALRCDAMETEQLSPTSWITFTDAQKNVVHHQPFVSDYEQTFLTIMQSIKQHEWPPQSPYFQRLELNIQFPAQDEPLGYEHEVISLKEALHEDLYFSIQEYFKWREGKDATARDCRPGQIVPVITDSTDGRYHIDIELKPYLSNIETHDGEALERATRPISVEQVNAELLALGGQAVKAPTVTGNTVNARYFRGSDRPILVTGGQHANESTGVVGALRAAKRLLASETAHLVLSPLDNPDGYAQYQAFIKDNPLHMHHAARYTALGDDLEYRHVAPFYEKEIRQQATMTGAQLHVNLHGYPCHEWTRPFSGYVPQGFDMWTIPKGFFLVIRHSHQGDWPQFAERFIDAVTRELQVCTDVIEMNRQQIALYEQHAGETGFRMINGFPCFVSGVDNPDFPLHLITEYPDETIYGDDFIQGHETQMETVLAAYRIFQAMTSAEC